MLNWSQFACLLIKDCHHSNLNWRCQSKKNSVLWMKFTIFNYSYSLQIVSNSIFNGKKNWRTCHIIAVPFIWDFSYVRNTILLLISLCLATYHFLMLKGFLAYTRGVRSSIVSNIHLVSSFCARALSEFETIKAKLSQLLKKKKKGLKKKKKRQ